MIDLRSFKGHSTLDLSPSLSVSLAISVYVVCVWKSKHVLQRMYAPGMFEPPEESAVDEDKSRSKHFQK